MASDRPPAPVLPFKRPRRFPADLDRLRRNLDDEDVSFEERDLDDGLACAEAAIEKGVPGGHEARADLLNIRAHRTHLGGDVDGAFAAWGAILAAYPTYLQAYVMRAEILDKRGEHQAAVAELDRYIERAPTDAGGYLHRAKLYQTHGDGERALANFRRATQLDRTSTEAHLGMAAALTAKGDARGARLAYARAAEEQVLDDADSYNMRGFMHFVSGQDELALADYDASLALAPNDVDTIAWRGLCRLRLGRHDGAIADFTRVIAMRPAEVRGFWRRGEALVAAGKPAEALRDLDRALALGDDPRGAATFARGMALQALGDVAGALAAYDTTIERDPGNVACRLRRFQIHNEARDWEKCQIDADAMLARAPDSPSLLLAHARLCHRNGRSDDALAAYTRLIALDPGNADAYHERSRLHAGMGNTVEAHADLAKAFELAPDDLDIRAAHGRNQAQAAKTDAERDAALQLIASSVELDPENPEVWASAAYRFREAGCPAQAIPFISRAIELDPENAEYYDERATSLRCAAPAPDLDPAGFRAACERALADADRAIEVADQDDDDIELYRTRADLREDLGDLHGAIADHTLMIEMAPWFIDAYMSRARLRKHTGDMPGAREDAAKVATMEEETIAELSAIHPEVTRMRRFNLDEA